MLGVTSSSPPTCVRIEAVSGTTTVVPSQACEDAQLTPPSSSAPCNRFPCPSVAVVWVVGDWGQCVNASTSAVLPCGRGVQVRSVECRVGSGDGHVVDDAACRSSLSTALVPSRQQQCDAGRCSCTTTAQCTLSGAHFVCNDEIAGECVCDGGWGGADCSVPLLLQQQQSSNASSVSTACSAQAVVAADGACCEPPSVIDGVTGLCCGSGAVTDGSGRCCPAGVAVDACGVCGGDGIVVDVSGVCCNNALSPSGLCCGSGVPWDSCGVCGGTNNCDATVVFTLPAGANASSLASAMGVPASAIVNFTVTGNGDEQVRATHCHAALPRGLVVV